VATGLKANVDSTVPVPGCIRIGGERVSKDLTMHTWLAKSKGQTPFQHL
jgi:hypothetical protein